jgi:MFS family permease
LGLNEVRERINARRRPRLVTPVFLLIMGATFAYFVSVGALIPTLPRFVTEVLGGGDVAVGLAIGSFALSAVFLRPLVGRMGDRRGRRILVVAGAGAVAVAVFGLTVVNSLPVLLALRLLSGAGEAAFYVGAASVINDLAPDERRGEALSYFSLALYGGLAVGPVLGETVLHASGFPLTWVVSGLSALVAALFGLPVPDTRPEPGEEGSSGRLVHPAALLPGIVMASSVWGLAGFNTFVPLYALQLGLGGSRAVFVVYSVIVLGIRSFGATIPDRLGPARCARYALITSAVGLAIVAVWGREPGLFVGTGVFAVGQALAFPALMTIAVSRAASSERAAVVGTFTAFFDFAFGFGSFSLGVVAEAFDYQGSFAVAGLVALAGFALLATRARRGAERRTAEQAA